MKKIIIILILLIPIFAWAGEKEELQWQIKYYQEKLVRLQAEFGITNGALKEAQAKLKAIKKPEKKGGEGKENR